ncbi:hypothetical protein SESBI_26558 [Sesbania bispinosa]|nr:hypothetical protein SESBI_26558 [Sesbania bispinosa]
MVGEYDVNGGEGVVGALISGVNENVMVREMAIVVTEPPSLVPGPSGIRVTPLPGPEVMGGELVQLQVEEVT